jgi:hypothetical protein
VGALVPVALVALTAVSGCIIGGGSDTPPSCFPDLTVRWRIVANGSTLARSCQDVGATSVRLSVGGAVTDLPCPLAQSTGSTPILLDVEGRYPVTVTLFDGATVLATGTAIVDVDCSGLSQTPIIDLAVGDGVCAPDLTISWRIISNLDGAALTCAEAGNADALTAWIDGGGLGPTPTPFTGPCPSNASQGSFVAFLPTTGSYNVSLELTARDILLSGTPVLVQPVDCSGSSRTPTAELLVNF